MTLLLLVHLAATLIMVGVIWFVQVVHYPLFSKVFAPYSRAHSRPTNYVVGPPMLLEAATALHDPAGGELPEVVHITWKNLYQEEAGIWGTGE